jgi:hypothetical protein
MGKKVKNAISISGTDADQIAKEIVKVEKRRIVKSTLCNERSSRSHCLVIFIHIFKCIRAMILVFISANYVSRA